ncbi:MAG: rhodanese-like domain-containing protein [Cellvibrionaceae bacterium]|nr:rhodanese-like domain-containing protein [Cellvibrionaceae bacterium]
MGKRVFVFIVLAISLFSAVVLAAKITIKPQFIEQNEYFSFSQREDTVVIDVRTQREFNAGHIPGAINIPHRDILRGRRSLTSYRDKNIVFYCHTGVRVGFVVDYLKKSNLSPDHIYHLRGNYRAWQARGLKIIKP